MAGTKNRSPRSSTPRHPIAMASTGKSPDPIPCALAAVLLPGSHAHCYHMQKTLFPGRARITVRGAYVLGPCLRAGCAHAAWAVYGSRIDSLGAGRRCLAPWVGGGRWSSASEQLLTAGRDWGGEPTHGRVVGRAGRCLPAVWSWTCVDAWTGAASGGSFRFVALCPTGDFGSCCIESGWIKEMLLIMHTLRVSRS